MIDRRALLKQSGAVMAALGAASVFDPLRALADTVKLPFDNGERPLVNSRTRSEIAWAPVARPTRSKTRAEPWTCGSPSRSDVTMTPPSSETSMALLEATGG
jgi:hypothetical protein